MAKKITSYKNLSIRWREDRRLYVLDARPIGGKRENWDTKSEALKRAKELFEQWNDGDLIVVEEKWSVDFAVEKYIEISKLRLDDEADRYGPSWYAQQTRQLHFIKKLTVNDFRLGSIKVNKLTTDMMVHHLWPSLKKSFPSDLTAMTYYVTFKQMMELCVTRKQIPSNVARDATSKTLNPRVVFPNKQARVAQRLREDVPKVAPETMQRILSQIPDLKGRLTVLTASSTGLRGGELCMIKIYQKSRHELGGIDFANE